MSKRLIIGLLGLNLCLLGAQWLATPDDVMAQSAGYDCCKESQDDAKFCCDQCCTSENCDRDAECQGGEEQME